MSAPPQFDHEAEKARCDFLRGLRDRAAFRAGLRCIFWGSVAAGLMATLCCGAMSTAVHHTGGLRVLAVFGVLAGQAYATWRVIPLVGRACFRSFRVAHQQWAQSVARYHALLHRHLSSRTE